MTSTADDDHLESSKSTLPAYVMVRPEGVFIKLSPPPAQDILILFIDRLFTNNELFAGLDYTCFQRLLFGDPTLSYYGNATEIKLARDIVHFLPQRKAVYKGVKISIRGDLAEYTFEPAFIERVTEEPIHGPAGEDGIAPVIDQVKKVETQPTKLDFDEFVADMWVKGVRFGIAVKTVREAIEKGTTGRMEIALQQEPTESTDAQIHEESEHLHRDNAPAILADGKADLRRTKNRFPQVTKNTPLLRKITRVLGKPGYKVTGVIIEPRVPLDIDLAKLAGEGTRIESSKDTEIIMAAMDGFLSLDDDTKQIMVMEKIENKSGISSQSTGDIKLDVEEYIEHGVMQEGRVIEGKHMTFHSDVFGTVISKGGNIELKSTLSGGRAQSSGGNITIKGRALNSTIETRNGQIKAEFADSCILIGKNVSIERAVNCTIVAETLQITMAEGCSIAGKNLHIKTANAHKNRETIISLVLPDLADFDQQIQAATSNRHNAKNTLEAKTQKLVASQSGPGLSNYLALATRIDAGEIQLNPAQELEWHKLIHKFAPLTQELHDLTEKAQAFEHEIARLTQARKTCGAGESCKIEKIAGDTIVRKLHSNRGMALLHNLPEHDLQVQLQQLGTVQERIFSGDSGSFEWHFEVTEPTTA